MNNYKQPYGTYSYRLEHPNYHSSSGVIELNTGRVDKKVTLLPAFGAIAITSNVSDARVTLDGKDTGRTTPCTLQEVASGSHTVTVQAEKYAPMQKTVTVEDGQTTQLRAELSARFAKIIIESLDNAQIYCNGSQLGTTRYDDNMMEGFYDLEVRLTHHESVTKQIQVVAGQPQQIVLNPVPIYGSLDITSTPHNATVLIDGKEYGKTPLTVEQLLEGAHQVILSAEGYTPETKSVTINGNESATLNVTLSDVPVHPKEKTFSVNGVSFTMRLVEGGTFQMGATSEQGDDADSDEKPVHRVTLSDYYIGETEVTQALWQAVMGTNVQSQRDKENSSWPLRGEGANYPMYYISWEDCQKFIRKLNAKTGQQFRLPTEAEWEYAARGGKKSRGYKYSGSNTLASVAWYDGNSDSKTHPVGTKQANELGLYDMSGNVWEWCYDWYDNYNSNAQTNPKGPAEGSNRVLRGGGWNFVARYCRVSDRVNFRPSSRSNHLGLRLAL